MRYLGAAQVARLADVPAEARPYYRALADAVRALILDGRIPVRVRMPAERHLAATLGVSRTTVTAAYDLLRERGYLESRQGSGSWTALPDPAVTADNPWLATGQDGLIQLHAAAPAAPSALREAMAEAVEDLPRYGMGNGYDPMGLPVLRERIAARYTARGLATRPEQILVTTGSQHALHLSMSLLAGPGDPVLVESPTYTHALDAARQRGARLVPVGISHEGWQADLVACALRQSAARVAYLMPDFQNPTGALMDDATRAAIAGAARRTDTSIVIDETWAELDLDHGLDHDLARRPGDGLARGLDLDGRVAGHAPMAAFDTDNRMITIGSASKLWWGGLRIGWLRASAALIRRLTVRRAAVDIASPVLEQLVVARLFDRLEETRAERLRGLRASRATLVAALRERLPAWEFAVPRGGGALWVRLDSGSAVSLSEAAATRGVRLAPGPWFGVEGTLEGYLRLPYTLPPAVLEEAVERVVAARDHGPAGAGRPADALVPMV
ncbi:PLP-dependent aminotransferase family protein [Nonomuraea sp. RK-328]|nr:PLP-dependent aminotransferase family protein [Nonomuraea sp. RK-328]